MSNVAPAKGIWTSPATYSLAAVVSSTGRGGLPVPDVDGNGNQGTIGVIHIECRKHGGEPSEYLVSFGGDSAGVFYLAKASGFDPLTALLRKLGVPGPALRTALQVLEIEQRHKIPNMTLTQDHFRELGLSD